MSGRIQIYTDGSSIGNPGPGVMVSLWNGRGRIMLKNFQRALG